MGGGTNGGGFNYDECIFRHVWDVTDQIIPSQALFMSGYTGSIVTKTCIRVTKRGIIRKQ